MTILTFYLPWPPTTNKIWRSAHIHGITRTYRSKEYNQFERLCLIELYSPKRKTITNNVEITLIFHPPTRRQYDVDNRIKPVFDVLTHAGIWDDDNQVEIVIAKKGSISKDNPGVEIKIKELKNVGSNH